MPETNIPVEYAVNWLCRMAAIDGVVSARERKLLQEFASTYGLDSNSLIRQAYAISNEVQTPEVETVDPREHAGRKFEEFVVSLCSDKSRFRLLAWRGDKISGETYALDTLLPDLHLRHSLDAAVVEYFVECKYRTTLKDGILDLTTQLGRYRKLSSAKYNTELFIAVGVGGSPSNPAHFYVIPSRMIKRKAVIHLNNFYKCLCPSDADGWHKYLNHYFNKWVLPFKAQQALRNDNP